MTQESKIKTQGTVFTPPAIVKQMLDLIEYSNPDILTQHCLEPSFGDGAFLVQIIDRYIKTAFQQHWSISQIKTGLETYLHGVELNQTFYDTALSKCNQIAKNYGIDNVHWQFVCGDSLELLPQLTQKMHFVVGNPPYVRVHHLHNFQTLKQQFSFIKTGMVDLYLVFYELGLNCLDENGKLCFITPSSWYTSLAGKTFRKCLIDQKLLHTIIDFESQRVFAQISTYTSIVLLTKDVNTFVTYQDLSAKITIPLIDIMINDHFYFTANNAWLKAIFNTKTTKVIAKNGVATLDDKFFIRDMFPANVSVLPILKASTGKWQQIFFPYTLDGKERNLSNTEQTFIGNHIPLYGRSQGLKDVQNEKLAISNLVSNTFNLKINWAPSQTLVYSGYYLVGTHADLVKCIELLQSQNFLKFIKALKKYKANSSYTFNTKDVTQYLNYTLEQESCLSTNH